MSSATAVTDGTFQNDVLKSSEPVLVDFWATWCQPCRMVAPVVDEIASENSGKLKVVKLDVDENQNTAMQYGVSSIPTLILFKDGQPVERVVGFNPKERLMSKLTPHLS
ncbi:MAG: thioredoxin [Chloroflexi bacterium]|nr:thioredoxin [Chloroflexota bacterium]